MAGCKAIIKPKISRRPISINIAKITLAAAGIAAHENSGPYCPRAGPTLPKAEMVVEIASTHGSPHAVIAIHPPSTNSIKLKKNTKTK